MGKVGSTSVCHALRRIFPNRSVYQTHKLSSAGVLHTMMRWIASPRAPLAHFPDHLASSIEIGERLECRFSNTDWYLFSLVREPVSRNVSAFFQNLHRRWLYHLSPSSREICQRILGTSADDAEVPPDRMEALVTEMGILFERNYRHELYDAWFDSEMRGPFGIDVLAEPFCVEAGFQVYRRGSVRLVLVRLENLQENFTRAALEWMADSPLAAELGSAPSLEERSNDGSTKQYRELYRSFLGSLGGSSRVIRDAYESRVARHFYTPEELTEFRARWSPIENDTDEV